MRVSRRVREDRPGELDRWMQAERDPGADTRTNPEPFAPPGWHAYAITDRAAYYYAYTATGGYTITVPITDAV